MKRISVFLLWVVAIALTVCVFVLDQASKEFVREKVRSVMRGGAK